MPSKKELAQRLPKGSKAVQYKRCKTYVNEYEKKNTAGAKLIQKNIRGMLDRKKVKQKKKEVSERKEYVRNKYDPSQTSKLIKIKNNKDKLQLGFKYVDYDKKKHGAGRSAKLYQLPSGTIKVKVKDEGIKKVQELQVKKRNLQKRLEENPNTNARLRGKTIYKERTGAKAERLIRENAGARLDRIKTFDPTKGQYAKRFQKISSKEGLKIIEETKKKLYLYKGDYYKQVYK